MQSITVTKSEAELGIEAQAARWQLYQQPGSHVNSQRIETSDDRVTPRCAPEDEKRADSDAEYDDDLRHWSPTSQPYAPATCYFSICVMALFEIKSWCRWFNVSAGGVSKHITRLTLVVNMLMLSPPIRFCARQERGLATI
jgi:hypothetical protein